MLAHTCQYGPQNKQAGMIYPPRIPGVSPGTVVVESRRAAGHLFAVFVVRRQVGVKVVASIFGIATVALIYDGLGKLDR